MKSIHEAFLPLLIASWLIGLGIFEYPLGRQRILFSFAYIVMCWLLCGSLCFSTTIKVFFRTAALSSTLALNLNMLVYLFSTLATCYYHKEYCRCLTKLAAVDETLEKLGTRKDYRKVRRTAMAITIFWCLYCSVLCYISIMLRRNLKFIDAMLIAAEINYPIFTNSINISKFGMLVRHVHSEMCRIAKEINTIFGAELTLEVTVQFFLMSDLLYLSYDVIVRSNIAVLPKVQFLAILSCWCALYFIRMLYFNQITENFGIKTKQTQRDLYRLANCVYDVEAREEVSQFILQVTRRPLKFTGCGLFEFGYKFMLEFYASMVMILVVLLQMYEPLHDLGKVWNANFTS
ncbi:hypothetical protein KM043_008979 [Ampulex compressa]|nr:hypothetical protein KM043_008979 [Ampulex compressa]